MDAIHRLSRACARGARGSAVIYLAIDLQVNPMAPLSPIVPAAPTRSRQPSVWRASRTSGASPPSLSPPAPPSSAPGASCLGPGNLFHKGSKNDTKVGKLAYLCTPLLYFPLVITKLATANTPKFA